MSGLGRKLQAFLRRDLLTTSSYRFALLLQAFQVGSGLWMYFFLSRTMGGTITPALEPYGSSFFAFVLVGVAFWGLFSNALIGAMNTIRGEQRSGTMEALLTMPIPAWLVVLGGAVQPLVLSVLELVLYLAGGALFFDVDWSRASWPAVMTLLGLSLGHGAVLGLFIAALIVVVKRGDQMVWVLASGLALMTGIFYPVEVLPAPLRALATLLPLTQALQGLRRALFRGASLGDLWPEISIVGLSTLGLAVLGTWVLNRALDYARVEGSLGQF
ncbi:MAG TPA: ABC transporter permease [Chloroflexia bacterium]|nr:ABC transporter permease [Chloroflexia bacterium]